MYKGFKRYTSQLQSIKLTWIPKQNTKNNVRDYKTTENLNTDWDVQ